MFLYKTTSDKYDPVDIVLVALEIICGALTVAGGAAFVELYTLSEMTCAVVVKPP